MITVEGEYLGVPLYRSGGPARPNHIKHIEIALQAKFPEDYRAFLHTTDGCFVGIEARHIDGKLQRGPKWGFPALDAMDYFQEFVEMSDMFSVKPAGGLLGKLNSFHFYDRVPVGIIPIGEYSCQGFVCLSLRDIDYGAVSVWDTADGWEDVDDRYLVRETDRLHHCANSFEEWWMSIQPMDSEAV